MEGMLPWNQRWELLVITAHRCWTRQGTQTPPNRCTPVSSLRKPCVCVCVCKAMSHVLAFVLFSKIWVENLHTESSKIRLIPCGVIYALQHPPNDLFQVLPCSLLLFQRPLHLLVLLWGKTIHFRWLTVNHTSRRCWMSRSHPNSRGMLHFYSISQECKYWDFKQPTCYPPFRLIESILNPPVSALGPHPSGRTPHPPDSLKMNGVFLQSPFKMMSTSVTNKDRALESKWVLTPPGRHELDAFECYGS